MAFFEGNKMTGGYGDDGVGGDGDGDGNADSGGGVVGDRCGWFVC